MGVCAVADECAAVVMIWAQTLDGEETVASSPETNLVQTAPSEWWSHSKHAFPVPNADPQSPAMSLCHV